MMRLPPHGDVQAALDRLKGAGFRLAALTNSTLAVARAQLANAGLSAAFEQILSADEVRRLKPSPEPYHHAARRLGIEIGEVMMVAAHGWDIAGALASGARAAFVARPGQMTIATAPPPELAVPDLAKLADRLAS
jgi:2-haloacid dehalogenase